MLDVQTNPQSVHCFSTAYSKVRVTEISELCSSGRKEKVQFQII